MKKILYLLTCIVFVTCKKNDNSNPIQPIAFYNPVKVTMAGYDGNIMEPFFTRDGKVLLFNNLNSAPENTNLHWALKVNDTNFQYKGEISGVNTDDLEGVPTMDKDGNMYFVSSRNYANTLSTLYQSQYSNGTASNVKIVPGISKQLAGWVNFDAEISSNGQTLYFVDAIYDQSGNPLTADLVLAQKKGTGFERLSNSAEIMKNINTEDALEYAACISENELELYFTRFLVPVKKEYPPQIYLARRSKTTEPFGEPSKILNITGFAEAPTISTDSQILYFHRNENGKFGLYMVQKI
jgi:Tol biopolymer transport system component